MSERNVRYGKSGSFGSANLIVHQGITNVFHQAIQPLCILRVIEEMGEILLGCHLFHSFFDIVQLPRSTHVNAALDIRKHKLTVPVPLLSPSH